MSDFQVYLRGVDLATLVEKYQKGEFATLITPLPVDVSEINQKPQTIVTIRENISNTSYQLDLGIGQTFACIGYKVIDKDGSYAVLDPNKEYNCMYCLRKIKRNPLGIPIRREERLYPEGSIEIYFHMVDIFCTFNCWKTEIRKRSQNTIYSQSMVYAAEIYYKCTGKDFADLKPASDQRILKIFNGPMSWKEFHTSTSTYAEKPGNMYFLPVLEYLEQTA